MNSVASSEQTLLGGVAHDAAMVLFTQASCQVGDAVEPKLKQLVHEQFPLVHLTVVSRTDAPALTAQWGVFAFPTVITFFLGKEHSRFVRTFSMDELAASLARPYELLFGRP
jgi:thioredoxin 1